MDPTKVDLPKTSFQPRLEHLVQPLRNFGEIEAVKKAYRFAAARYGDRPHGGGSLMDHLLRVAHYLQQDDAARGAKFVIAALLSRVLESPDTRYEELIPMFGLEVASIARTISRTDDDNKLGDAVVDKVYQRRIRAAPQAVVLVVLAGLLDDLLHLHADTSSEAARAFHKSVFRDYLQLADNHSKRLCHWLKVGLEQAGAAKPRI